MESTGSVELFRPWELTTETMVKRAFRSKIITIIAGGLTIGAFPMFMISGIDKTDRQEAAALFYVGLSVTLISLSGVIWGVARWRVGEVLIQIYKHAEMRQRSGSSGSLVALYKEAIQDFLKGCGAIVQRDVRNPSTEHIFACMLQATKELQFVEAAERSRMSRSWYFLLRRG